MVPQLRVGLEDYLVVRSHDVLRIHDRHHAERLLGDQGLVPTDELDMLLDRLAAGDVMLVRRERPRPLPCIPRVDHQPLATSPAPERCVGVGVVDSKVMTPWVRREV